MNGQPKKVVPFVGTDTDGPFSQMGIGVLCEEDGTECFWGLGAPHSLVRSWRGMMLLGSPFIPSINERTLANCWFAAKKDAHDLWCHKRHFEELTSQLDGKNKKNLMRFRAKILLVAPAGDVICQIVGLCQVKGISVDNQELLDENIC
ncbi:MAG: hypothetical protein WC120_02740 [Parcubacteria group bacterium]